jgi:type IV pilus assembly protein PilA
MLWMWIPLALLAIVTVIAIPNLKLARMTANEGSAKRSLHAINAAEAEFSTSNPTIGYVCSLGILGDAHLLPASLASGKDKGYWFELSDCGLERPTKTYRVVARPVARSKTGYWVFCSDQTARVKGSPDSERDCFDQGVAQY